MLSPKIVSLVKANHKHNVTAAPAQITHQTPDKSDRAFPGGTGGPPAKTLDPRRDQPRGPGRPEGGGGKGDDDNEFRNLPPVNLSVPYNKRLGWFLCKYDGSTPVRLSVDVDRKELNTYDYLHLESTPSMRFKNGSRMWVQRKGSSYTVNVVINRNTLFAYYESPSVRDQFYIVTPFTGFDLKFRGKMLNPLNPKSRPGSVNDVGSLISSAGRSFSLLKLHNKLWERNFNRTFEAVRDQLGRRAEYRDEAVKNAKFFIGDVITNIQGYEKQGLRPDAKYILLYKIQTGSDAVVWGMNRYEGGDQGDTRVTDFFFWDESQLGPLNRYIGLPRNQLPRTEDRKENDARFVKHVNAAQVQAYRTSGGRNDLVLDRFGTIGEPIQERTGIDGEITPPFFPGTAAGDDRIFTVGSLVYLNNGIPDKLPNGQFSNINGFKFGFEKSPGWYMIADISTPFAGNKKKRFSLIPYPRKQVNGQINMGRGGGGTVPITYAYIDLDSTDQLRDIVAKISDIRDRLPNMKLDAIKDNNKDKTADNKAVVTERRGMPEVADNIAFVKRYYPWGVEKDLQVGQKIASVTDVNKAERWFVIVSKRSVGDSWEFVLVPYAAIRQIDTSKNVLLQPDQVTPDNVGIAPDGRYVQQQFGMPIYGWIKDTWPKFGTEGRPALQDLFIPIPEPGQDIAQKERAMAELYKLAVQYYNAYNEGGIPRSRADAIKPLFDPRLHLESSPSGPDRDSFRGGDGGRPPSYNAPDRRTDRPFTPRQIDPDSFRGIRRAPLSTPPDDRGSGPGGNQGRRGPFDQGPSAPPAGGPSDVPPYSGGGGGGDGQPIPRPGVDPASVSPIYRDFSVSPVSSPNNVSEPIQQFDQLTPQTAPSVTPLQDVTPATDPRYYDISPGTGRPQDLSQDPDFKYDDIPASKTVIDAKTGALKVNNIIKPDNINQLVPVFIPNTNTPQEDYINAVNYATKISSFPGSVVKVNWPGSLLGAGLNAPWSSSYEILQRVYKTGNTLFAEFRSHANSSRNAFNFASSPERNDFGFPNTFAIPIVFNSQNPFIFSIELQQLSQLPNESPEDTINRLIANGFYRNVQLSDGVITNFMFSKADDRGYAMRTEQLDKELQSYWASREGKAKILETLIKNGFKTAGVKTEAERDKSMQLYAVLNDKGELQVNKSFCPGALVRIRLNPEDSYGLSETARSALDGNLVMVEDTDPANGRFTVSPNHGSLKRAGIQQIISLPISTIQAVETGGHGTTDVRVDVYNPAFVELLKSQLTNLNNDQGVNKTVAFTLDDEVITPDDIPDVDLGLEAIPVRPPFDNPLDASNSPFMAMYSKYNKYRDDPDANRLNPFVSDPGRLAEFLNSVIDTKEDLDKVIEIMQAIIILMKKQLNDNKLDKASTKKIYGFEAKRIWLWISEYEHLMNIMMRKDVRTEHKINELKSVDDYYVAIDKATHNVIMIGEDKERMHLDLNFKKINPNDIEIVMVDKDRITDDIKNHLVIDDDVEELVPFKTTNIKMNYTDIEPDDEDKEPA